MENDIEIAGVVRTYLAEKATGSVTWVMEESLEGGKTATRWTH